MDAHPHSPVPVNTKLELHPSVFQEITLRWDRPHIYLIASSLNRKLQTQVPPISNEKVWAVDAMTLSIFDENVQLIYISSSFQDSEELLQDHSYYSCLAKTSLVPRIISSVLYTAILTSSQGRSIYFPSSREERLIRVQKFLFARLLLPGIPSERGDFL